MVFSSKQIVWSVPYSQSAGKEYFLANSDDYHSKFQYLRLLMYKKLKKGDKNKIWEINVRPGILTRNL